MSLTVSTEEISYIKGTQVRSNFYAYFFLGKDKMVLYIFKNVPLSLFEFYIILSSIRLLPNSRAKNWKPQVDRERA